MRVKEDFSMEVMFKMKMSRKPPKGRVEGINISDSSDSLYEGQREPNWD